MKKDGILSRGLEPGKLTLGTAVYDDFDGLFFTIKSLQVYHPHIFENAEIVVVDNNPKGIDAKTIESFIREINYNGNVRLVKLEDPVGTAPAKQKVIDSATNDWVLVFDCHVLFEPGAFDYLLDVIDDPKHQRDILSGPLVGADGKSLSTHFEWKWRGQLLGIWGTNPKAYDKDNEPFEIPGCGTGVFAVNRHHFPGFHPAFRGFGAEELYIHEKIRRNGGAAYCIPGFRWHHRFHRPRGVPYPNLMWDRVRNYVIAFKELGMPIDEIYNYYVLGGFFSKNDWEFLIRDPIKNETPPLLFEVADDAPEKAKILAEKKQQNLPAVQEIKESASDMQLSPIPPQYRDFVQKGGSVAKMQEENMRKKIAAIPDEELAKIAIPDHVQQQLNKLPPEERKKAERTVREGILFTQWRNAMQHMLQQTAPGDQPKSGCCGGRGELHKPQFREEVIAKLKDKTSLQEVGTEKDLPSELDAKYVEMIKEAVKDADRIIEIGDDPIGGTLTILKAMKQDAIFVSYYIDQKFLPELNEVGRIAAQEGKNFKIIFGRGWEDLDIKDATFDFALLNPTFVDAENIYNMLKKVLPFVNGRAFLHKSDKYWAFTAEQQPGMLAGVARFLNEPENIKWSIIKMHKEGLGLAVLSNIPADKPKLPSAVKMASNFATALAKHISTGAREVTKEELEYRLKMCSVCEYRNDNRCSLCGCYITSNILSKGKAFWKDQHCPIGRWNREEEKKA